jgi:predicted aspartyl protease
MRSESSFEIDGDLIVIRATIAGPSGQDIAWLVLDTGSVLTTLAPWIAEALGYTSADRVSHSVVRTAVAEERGYILSLASFSAFCFKLAGLRVNVADLGHDIDGVIGMDFLSHFNLEIRPAERRLIAERIVPVP